MHDWDAVRQRGFFDGYNLVVWVVVMLQASSSNFFLSFELFNDVSLRLSEAWLWLPSLNMLVRTETRLSLGIYLTGFFSRCTDNILKGFATSVSIVLSCLFSFIVFRDLQLELNFILGTGLVIGATFLYGMQSHQSSTTPGGIAPRIGDAESDKEEIGHTYSKAGNDRGYVKLTVD